MSTKKINGINRIHEFHPADIYNSRNRKKCIHLKNMYNNIAKLNVLEGNQYCEGLNKEIEEKCQPTEEEFNKRYKYIPETGKFGIDIDDNEQCRLFKLWFNQCNMPELCMADFMFKELLKEC